MMTMTMQGQMVEETKSRTLYTTSAGDCSLAPPALLGISAAGECSCAPPALPIAPRLLLSYTDHTLYTVSRALCR